MSFSQEAGVERFFSYLEKTGSVRRKKVSESLPQVEGEIFRRAQTQQVFDDSKNMVDSIPREKPEKVMQEFRRLHKEPGFDIDSFVSRFFKRPRDRNIEALVPQELSLKEYIQRIWSVLTRTPSENREYGTRIPLKHRYIVPGGRFREIYYWDSYFTLLGPASQGNAEIVREMVDNFSYLIEREGFIPNGNRVYYLTRSQPPFYVSMLELAEELDLNKAEEHAEKLEKEYRFWMDGAEKLKPEESTGRVVKTPEGSLLNRYWDEEDRPRPESFPNDRRIAEKVENKRRLYRNIRAACESGWDFSSRWTPTGNLEDIETADIAPVDLNSIIFHMENRMSQWFNQKGDTKKSDTYRREAKNRKEAIDRYFWSEEKGFYFDYNWKKEEQTDTWSLAALAPLFFKAASQQQADRVAGKVRKHFLFEGGLVTTLTESGYQWDKPNGWAPLHWIAVKGFENYGYSQLAEEIAERWTETCRVVYDETEKMLEKYNVINVSSDANGGYPAQYGFGWTNGVTQAFMEEYGL